MNKKILSIAVGGLLLLNAGLVTDSRATDENTGLQFGGSIRGRYEYINWMNDGDDGSDTKDDRGRIRYRLRLDAKATINPNAAAYFRLVSGTDSRSGNVTLGGNPDFGPDSFSIRYAAMVITPWDDGQLPSGNGK